MDSVNVENLHGPLFLGYLFNTTLLGIFMTQAYLYYTTYKRDNLWTKTAVGALVVVNVANTTFITAYLYQILIIDFGSPSQSIELNWLAVSERFSTVIIVLSAQTFFAWRAYAMTSSWLYVIFIMVPAITSASGGSLTGVYFVRHPDFRNVRDSTTVITLWLIAGTVCDALIVVIRLWYMVSEDSTASLLRTRPRHFIPLILFHQKTQPMKLSSPELTTDRAIRVLLGSGLLTLLVAAADLIVYMKMKGSGMHLILNLPLCKLFSSNVMHCLNSRHGFKVRWSSEIIPHPLYRTEDVRPGDVIEFANIKTTMRSDDASELQSRFGDAETPDSPTTISNESEEYKKHRWSAV